MNKKLVWIVAALLVAVGAGAIYYFFVKDRNQHLKYIPKDAAMAFHCDLKSLHDKSDFEKVKKMKFFTKMMDDNSRSETNHEWTDILIKKTLTTGIDVLSDPVAFMSNRNDKMFAGLSIKLTNSGDFNRFMKKYKTSEEPKKSETYTSLELEDEDLLVAWNDEAALFLTSPSVGYGAKGKAELKKVLDIYMTLDEKESLGANDDYKKFRKEKQDIGLFVTYDGLFDYMGTLINNRSYDNPGMEETGNQMDKMKAKFKGVNAGLALSFENTGLVGKVFTFGENMTKLMDEAGYTGKPLSDDIIKNISSDQVLGTLFLNYNISKMIATQVETNPKTKEQIEKFANEMGLTINDLKEIFGGEIAFSFVDAEVLKEETKYEDIDPITEELVKKTRTVQTPMPYFTFSFNVNNNTLMQRLVDALNSKMNKTNSSSEYNVDPTTDDSQSSNLWEQSDNTYVAPKAAVNEENNIEKRGDNYYFKKDKIEISIMRNAVGYTITNSPKIAAALEKNRSLSPDPKLIGKDFFTNNSAGFKLILDAEKYPKELIDYIKMNYMADEKTWKILKNFEEISFQMPTGKSYEADFSIMMSEGKGNSLYRLLEMFDESVIN